MSEPTYVVLVHKPGRNPGHAVIGKSSTTMCGQPIGPEWGTARGLIPSEHFERVATKSVIAGACPECVSKLTPQPAVPADAGSGETEEDDGIGLREAPELLRRLARERSPTSTSNRAFRAANAVDRLAVRLRTVEAERERLREVLVQLRGSLAARYERELVSKINGALASPPTPAEREPE